MAAHTIVDAAPPRHVRGTGRIRLSRWVILVLVLVAAVAWLVPLWSIIITPMKTVPEYFRVSVWGLPSNPANLFVNIKTAWDTAGLGPGFLASLFYGVSGAAL